MESFFTPRQLRRRIRSKPLPTLEECYEPCDPYGNSPDMRVTAQPREPIYTPIDEENLDEQYRC